MTKPTPSSPILLTGTTGGLGSKILSDLLSVHKVDPKAIIATSRSESNRSGFEDQGVQFRVVDYSSPITTLATSFQGIGTLLFVSSAERDSAKRNIQHSNVIEAAKQAGVARLWYVSLAFGGFGNESKVFFQETHYYTEELLVKSGLDFLSLRAGIYTDAFPLFLNWYPSSRRLALPILTPPLTEGKVAWTSRDELAEGIAALLANGLAAYPSIVPKTERKIILLTGTKEETQIDLIGAIDRGRGVRDAEEGIPVKFLEPSVWVEDCSRDDEGKKPRAWFEGAVAMHQGFANGDGETIDGALETLLGRRPESGSETVERLIRENPGYTWHQNHNRG